MNEIPSEDLKIEAYPIEGIHPKGGQHAGTPCGIRLTHIPTGITAYVDVGRSQFRNKEIAEDMILAAITHPRFRP